MWNIFWQNGWIWWPHRNIIFFNFWQERIKNSILKTMKRLGYLIEISVWLMDIERWGDICWLFLEHQEKLELRHFFFRLIISKLLTPLKWAISIWGAKSDISRIKFLQSRGGCWGLGGYEEYHYREWCRLDMGL